MGIISELGTASKQIDDARKWLGISVVLRHQSSSLFEFNKYATFIHERTFEMAKKVKESNKKEMKKAEFKGFANIELNQDEKAEARAWIKDVEAVQVELDEMLASLYKVSVQKSEALGCYQATAFAADAGSVNAGLILSAYAPHWFDAMAMLAYKHAIKCEGVWDVGADAEADAWG